MEEETKAIIYARESSKDSDKAPPIEKQINRAKDFIKKGDLFYENTYSDKGYSGGDWGRPGWKRLFNDVKRNFYKKGTTLIVWNQDRLARDTEQFLNYYRILKEKGINIYSMTEGLIDMETLGGRVKHTTLAMASEIFRLQTSDKVKKSYQLKRDKALQRGERVVWGRKPSIPFKAREEAVKIAINNPEWGYRKISKALKLLGWKVSHVWVMNILKEKGVK